MRRSTVQCFMMVAVSLCANAGWHEVPALAATRLTDDLADLFRAAEAVVEADVVSSSPGERGNSGIPMTRVVLKVDRVFKGAPTIDAVLNADVLGGDTGDVRTVVPGQPRLLPGTRVIVLLSKFGRLQNWRVIGGDAGEIQLGFGDDGLPIARRACGSNFNYYVTDPHSLSGFKAISVAELSEEQVLNLVEALATTGRPVVAARIPAAPAPKPTSEPAQQVSVPAVSSAPSNSQVVLARTPSSEAGTSAFSCELFLFSLVFIALAWVVGRRSLRSLRYLRAKF